MRQIVAVLAVSLITACSSKSLTHCEKELANIKLESISGTTLPDKMQFKIKQAIKEVFDANSAKYNLKIKYATSKTSFQTQQDATYNRIRVGLELQYDLIDTKGKVINDGVIRAYDSLTVSNSPYSDMVSEEETYFRLIDITVQKLRLQLLRDIKCIDLDE